MDRKTVSKRVKQARLEAGLKQKHIAECLEIPISAVSLLENGNRGLDVLELVKLAKLCAKQPEWFYMDYTMPGKRRWSDKETDTFEAMNAFKAAPSLIQACVARAMLAFFRNYKNRGKIAEERRARE